MMSEEFVERYAEKFDRDPNFVRILEILREEEGDPYRQAIAIYLMLDSTLSWNTTCINCARLLDSCYEAHAEVEQVREKLEAMRSFLNDDSKD